MNLGYITIKQKKRLFMIFYKKGNLAKKLNIYNCQSNQKE